MDGEQDRDQQGCKRQGKDPALPEVVRFPQSSEADPKNQDDAEQIGDVESKPSHDTIVQRGIHPDRSPVFMMTWLPVGFDILIESIEGLDRCATFGALHQC